MKAILRPIDIQSCVLLFYRGLPVSKTGAKDSHTADLSGMSLSVWGLRMFGAAKIVLTVLLLIG